MEEQACGQSNVKLDQGQSTWIITPKLKTMYSYDNLFTVLWFVFTAGLLWFVFTAGLLIAKGNLYDFYLLALFLINF